MTKKQKSPQPIHISHCTFTGGTDKTYSEAIKCLGRASIANSRALALIADALQASVNTAPMIAIGKE